MTNQTIIIDMNDSFERDMEVLYYFELVLAKMDLSDTVTDRRPLHFAGFSHVVWDTDP